MQNKFIFYKNFYKTAKYLSDSERLKFYDLYIRKHKSFRQKPSFERGWHARTCVNNCNIFFNSRDG